MKVQVLRDEIRTFREATAARPREETGLLVPSDHVEDFDRLDAGVSRARLPRRSGSAKSSFCSGKRSLKRYAGLHGHVFCVLIFIVWI